MLQIMESPGAESPDVWRLSTTEAIVVREETHLGTDGLWLFTIHDSPFTTIKKAPPVWRGLVYSKQS